MPSKLMPVRVALNAVKPSDCGKVVLSKVVLCKLVLSEVVKVALIKTDEEVALRWSSINGIESAKSRREGAW